MWIKIVALRIFFSKLFTFVLSVLNFEFLTASLSTTSLVFFKSAGTLFYLPTSNSSIIAFKLINLVGELASFLMSNLSISAFKPSKSDGSAPVAWSNSFLASKSDGSIILTLYL